jgi:hypothetical protein
VGGGAVVGVWAEDRTSMHVEAACAWGDVCVRHVRAACGEVINGGVASGTNWCTAPSNPLEQMNWK